MNAKKLLAVLVVLMMASVGLVAFASCQPESQATAVSSDKTIVLNLTDDMQDVSAFGGGASWSKDGTTRILTLENVSFSTTASCAVNFDTGGDITDVKVVLKGNNYLSCRYNSSSPVRPYIDSACIITKDTVSITFSGDGYLKAESKATSGSPSSSYGIYSSKTITIENCSMDMNSSSIVTTQTTEFEGTCGIFSESGLIINNAVVRAHSGNVTGTGTVAGTAASAGVAVFNEAMNGTISVTNGVLYAIGGTVRVSDTPASAGLLCAGNITLTGSICNCYSGSATDTATETKNNSSISAGIWITGSLTVSKSTYEYSSLMSVGGNVNTKKGEALSAGIYSMCEKSNTFSFTDSSVFCSGSYGRCLEVKGVEGTFGIVAICDSDVNSLSISANGSVFESYDSYNEKIEKGKHSSGIAIIKAGDTPTATGGISITNSGFYASGKSATFVGSITVSMTNPVLVSHYKDGAWNDITDDPSSWNSALNDSDNTIVYVIYKRVVYLKPYSDYRTPIIGIMIDGTSYQLPECDFPAPEGKSFKHWSDGSKSYNPGDYVSVGTGTYDQYVVVNAVWEGGESGGDNTAVIIAIVAIAVVAVGIVGVAFFMNKP